MAVRNIRRQAKGDIGALLEMSEITEDDSHRAESRLQDLTDQHIAEIDQVLANKEKELLEV